MHVPQAAGAGDPSCQVPSGLVAARGAAGVVKRSFHHAGTMHVRGRRKASPQAATGQPKASFPTPALSSRSDCQ